MALSQADFYAYSRATGAPVPENPEDRAQMAPEVLAFRRNQLKAPQQQREQGPDPLSVGLGVGLALAGGVGAALGARRLFGGRKQAANAGVRQVNLAEMAAPESPVRRVATESVPEPSKVATQEPNPWDLPYTPKPETGVTPVSVSVLPQKFLSAAEVATQEPTSYPSLEERQRVYAEVAAKPKSELQPVYKPKGGTQEEPLITDPNTGEIFKAGKSPSSFAERYISLRPELKGQRTDLPIGRTPGTFKEFSQQAEEFNPRSYIEARGSVAPAEDLTSVQQQSLPQVIDQKINAVESGEDQMTGRVIKQLTTADPWGKATVPPSVVNEQTTGIPLLPAAAVSPREQAQSFLQTKFEELSNVIPGRYRRERAMGLDPDIAEAIELYASTGDPNVLSRLSKTPSSPVTVSPRVQTELKETEIPTGKFYEPTGKGEFIDDLIEKDINLTNKISSLGAQKQAIINRIQEIDELEPQLRFAAADEPGQGGYYTRMLNKILFEKQSLNSESINVDLGDALAQRDFVRNRMESLQSLGTQYRPLKRQEGVRPFFEVDPETNKIIPETFEIRSGRPSVELEEQKTGGGRAYAMYDPESQVGSSIGAYGIEPRNYPIADPELKPTALQREETKATLRRGEYPKFQAAVKSTPEQKRQSLDVSEALRRARIEGRDPNMILKQFGIGS